MAYNHILKRRRLDLNLSVQDVAIQTHLAPEYIRAIEENNLDIFSDDFSYVRYFTKAYSEAIGVNWQAIAPEVEASISVYTTARDQALARASAQMMENTARTSVQKPKKQRLRIQKYIDKASDKLSPSKAWAKQNQLTKSLLVAGVCALIVLIALNAVTDFISARSLASAQAQKEQELLEKEQETQRLAQQLASQKEASGENALSITVANVPDTVNAFYVAGGIDPAKKVRFQFMLAEPSHVDIRENGRSVYSQNIEKDQVWEYSITAETQVEISFDHFIPGDYLNLWSTGVPIDPNGFVDGVGTVVLHFVQAIPEAPAPAVEEPAAEEGWYDEYGNWIPADQGWIDPDTGEYVYE